MRRGARAGGPRGPGRPSDAPAPTQVAEILGAILVHLPVVDHAEVRRLLTEGILLLAHHHQDPVLTALLRQPLPMERWVPGARGGGGGRGLPCDPDHARPARAETSQRTRASRGPCLTLSSSLPWGAQPWEKRGPRCANSGRRFTQHLVRFRLAGLVSLAV